MVAVRAASPLQGRLAPITPQENLTSTSSWAHWKRHVRLVTLMNSAHQVGYSERLWRAPDEPRSVPRTQWYLP
jgi:hypothetical protein